MPKPARPLRFLLLPFLRKGGAFARQQKGAVLIEFGLLAIPFFMIMVAILETAVIFMASQFLDGAINDASRLVATGQAKEQSFDVAKFRAAICDELYGIFVCPNLLVKVSTVTSFNSAAPTKPWDKDGKPIADWEAYNAGVGSSIVMAQVFYRWPTLVGLLGFNLSNSEDGSRLMAATRIFVNEPFG